MLFRSVTSDDGGLGLSSQYGGRTRPPLHDGALTGMPLREAAGLIRSWNLVEAALGAAAINAWYNRADRVDAVGWDVTAPGADPTAFAGPGWPRNCSAPPPVPSSPAWRAGINCWA